MSQLLTTAGFRCERPTHRQINTAQMELMANRVKQVTYAMVWMAYPTSGVHVRARRYGACLRAMAQWPRAAVTAG